jgi:hypothetical protein
MSGSEMVPRAYNTPAPRRVRNALHGLTNETRFEQASIRAISRIGEAGMFAVIEVKNMQRDLELSNPAASAELSAISATVCMAIAASINRFAQDVG